MSCGSGTRTNMKAVDVEKLAKELMGKHLSTLWTFHWQRPAHGMIKVSAGEVAHCSPDSHTIVMNKDWSDRSGRMLVHDILLHEIAHALLPDPFKSQHNEDFKDMCRKIGTPQMYKEVTGVSASGRYARPVIGSFKVGKIISKVSSLFTLDYEGGMSYR